MRSGDRPVASRHGTAHDGGFQPGRSAIPVRNTAQPFTIWMVGCDSLRRALAGVGRAGSVADDGAAPLEVRPARKTFAWLGGRSRTNLPAERKTLPHGGARCAWAQSPSDAACIEGAAPARLPACLRSASADRSDTGAAPERTHLPSFASPYANGPPLESDGPSASVCCWKA